MNTKLQTLNMQDLAHVSGGFSDVEFSMVANEPSNFAGIESVTPASLLEPSAIIRRTK